MKVQAKSFHLNGHIIGFRPQTQKLELPHKTLSNTLARGERVNQLFILKSPSSNASTQESTYFNIKTSSTKGNIDSASFVPSSEIYLP